jgi:hypothetical protein
MRRTLFITTAIAGLLAGTVFAGAQGMPKQGGPDAGSPGQMQRGPEGGQQGQGKQAPQGRETQREQGKQGTTGQGGREGEQGRQGQREQGKQGGRDGEQGKQGQREQGKQGTTGQGGRENGQGRGDATQQRQDQPKAGERNAQPQQPSTQGKANITVEQRTRLRERVLAHGPRIPNNIRVSINVGVVIPTTVHVVAVTDDIIEIYPNYRGYFYFVYEDEIIIVDRGHRIVAVIAV